MNNKQIDLENYIKNLEKKIPKNLILKKLSNKNINIANDYLSGEDKLSFNFSKLTSHFGDDWDYDEYPLGYLMQNTDDGSTVGFLGTICSRRNINNNNIVCCNLVHWYIEKDFRIFGFAFFLPLLNKKSIVYGTTPKKSILGIYEKLGFEIKIIKYSVGFSINLKAIFSKNYKRFKISIVDQEKEKFLNVNDKQIYNDHKNLNCLHFIVFDKNEVLKPCYFIAKKVKRYHINVLDILYISNAQDYRNYAPEIFTKISLLFNKIFIGQRYFLDEEILKYNPKSLSKTVERFFPIKSYNNCYVDDVLYSDYVLFDI